MRAKKDFVIGDLVWAKMKGFPFWPGTIVNPPADAKSPKKAQHYVFFFGTENYAWILDENIVHHSEEMLQSASSKKKSTLLKTAIEKITQEAPQKAKTLVKEKESPKKSTEVSKINTEKKTAKKQRIKIKALSLKARRKTASKRRILDEIITRSSPSAKCSRVTPDLSESTYNAPSNINFDHEVTSKPLDELAVCPSVINKREYFELQPIPALEVRKSNDTVRGKNIWPTDKKIGFIGLGMIGQRLAKNLLNTGHDVTVWNRTPDKCKDFAMVGALVAQTPSDVVEKCDIIFCCVSGPEASTSLVFGNCGILSGLEKSPPGSKGYVEMTVIDPNTSIRIAEAITQKGGKYVEAPISGSRKMADDGTLIILGAGDRELFITCDSCFYTLSKHTYYLGSDIGIGSKMNLIYSLVNGVSHAALAEAMALVERSNLQPENFLEILAHLPLNSPLIKEKGQAMSSRQFETNTSLKYLQKDLSLVLSLGHICRQQLLVTAATNELFKHAKLLRYSDHDTSAVFLGAKY